MKMINLNYLKRILKFFKFNYRHLKFKEIEYNLDFYSYYSKIKKDCTLANELWCLKVIFMIQTIYVKSFYTLKQDNFYGAWCSFALVETYYKNLVKHYDKNLDEYKINSIYEYTKKFQKLFPYNLFSSVELKITKLKCNICGKERTSFKSVCNHRVGELYCGKLCKFITLDIEAIANSLVENPKDKCTVTFINGKDTYNYGQIKSLISNLNFPFDDWDFKIYTVKKPQTEFKNLTPNDLCPCGSGRTYEECCLNKKEIDTKHLEFFIKGLQPPIIKYDHYHVNKKNF